MFNVLLYRFCPIESKDFVRKCFQPILNLFGSSFFCKCKKLFFLLVHISARKYPISEFINSSLPDPFHYAHTLIIAQKSQKINLRFLYFSVKNNREKCIIFLKRNPSIFRRISSLYVICGSPFQEFSKKGLPDWVRFFPFLIQENRIIRTNDAIYSGIATVRLHLLCVLAVSL